MPTHVAVAFSGDPTQRTCSADGEMLWEKGMMGEDNFSLCYAPSLEEGSPGPTGGHFTCDKGTKFSVEVPLFCCKKPRIENEFSAFKKVSATDETCGDTLAVFEPTTQRFKFERGPTSTATFEELSELQESGFGNKAPSPVAFKAFMEGKGWKPVIQTTCSGRLGTLVKWKDDPNGRAEFCPTGTPPVRGEGYASWFCDGAYIQEKRLHCCKVHGKLRCVNHLIDRSTAAGCRCQGVGGAQEKPESVLPQESALTWPLFALMLASPVLQLRLLSTSVSSAGKRRFASHGFL